MALFRQFRVKNMKFKTTQKHYFDLHHGAKPLSPLEENTPICVKTNENTTTGRIMGQSDAPRSYIVKTESEELRRNKSHILPIPTTNTNEVPVEILRENILSTNTKKSIPSPIKTWSQTGTIIRPPDWYYPTIWNPVEGEMYRYC